MTVGCSSGGQRVLRLPRQLCQIRDVWNNCNILLNLNLNLLNLQARSKLSAW